MKTNADFQKKPSNRKRKIINRIECLPVHEPNIVFYNEYLEIYVGAKWQQIKSSLYDAGYTSAEVNDYRNEQLKDFNKICKEKNLCGIV